MSTSTTLRRSKRIVVAVAGLGLAAATLAPAAGAAPSPVQTRDWSHGKVYVQPVCKKGTYNCNLPGNPRPTKPVTIPVKSGGFFSKVIGAPVRFYVGKVPGKKVVVISVATKGYRAVSWLWH